MKPLKFGLGFLSVITMMTTASPSVQAGTDRYIGEIMMFSGSFCPRGYVEASGGYLPVPQYTGLFTILGNLYGGDGVRTFRLPDLRGRVPIGAGKGEKLTKKELGETGGSEWVENSSGTGSIDYLEPRADAKDITVEFAKAKTTKFSENNHVPENNLPPYLAIKMCIAFEGKFPSRD